MHYDQCKSFSCLISQEAGKVSYCGYYHEYYRVIKKSVQHVCKDMSPRILQSRILNDLELLHYHLNKEFKDLCRTPARFQKHFKDLILV